MSKLRDHIRFLKSVTAEYQEEAILGILYDHEDQVIDLNTQQLMMGKTSEGGEVTPGYRSKNYADFKLTRNPKGVVDLKLDGGFHSSFFVKPSSKFPVLLGATDTKTKDLTNKYGEEIFGLNQDSKKTLNEFIKPSIQEWYKNLLQL